MLPAPKCHHPAQSCVHMLSQYQVSTALCDTDTSQALPDPEHSAPTDTVGHLCSAASPPPFILQTHQAPFLSAQGQNSCPVQQGGRAEGILEGLCLPARDLRNQTNKSPREHHRWQTCSYTFLTAAKTCLSQQLCKRQQAAASLFGERRNSSAYSTSCHHAVAK